MPIRATENPEILSTRGIHLFHFSTSNCSMRVRLVLEEKQLPWVDRYVDLRKQENLTSEYFDIHPQGLVPAIIHDGTIVYESADILLYLEDKFPEIPMIPAEPQKKQEMEEWLEWTRVNHLKAIKTWAYGRNKKPTKTPESMQLLEELQKDRDIVEFHKLTLADGGIPEEKIQVAEDMLLEAFSRIEGNLDHGDFILGDQVTLADIAWIPQYSLLQRNNFPFEQFPNLMAWVERWKTRPSYLEAVSKWMPSAA